MSVEFHTLPIKAIDLMVFNNNKASFVMSPKVTKNKKWDERNMENRIGIKVFKNLECGFIMSVEFHTPPIKANDLMVVNNNKASFVMSWQEHENRQKFELSVCVVASSLLKLVRTDL